jgi:hypothetical protein
MRAARVEETELRRVKQEQQRHQRTLKEAEERRALAHQAYEIERKRKERATREDKIRRRKAREADEARLKKQDARRAATEAIIAEQQRDLMVRQQRMEASDRKRGEARELRQQQREREMAEKRARAAARIQETLQMQVTLDAERAEEFRQREAAAEERRRQFEEQRDNERQDAADRARDEQDKRQSAHREMRRIEEDKRNAILAQQAATDDHLRRRTEQKMQDKEDTKQRSSNADAERRAKYNAMQAHLDNRIRHIGQKRLDKESSQGRVQAEKEQMQQNKREAAFIKEEARREGMIRQQRIDEYKANQTMEKLRAEAARVDRFFRSHEETRAKRRQFMAEAEQRRAELSQQLEKEMKDKTMGGVGGGGSREAKTGGGGDGKKGSKGSKGKARPKSAGPNRMGGDAHHSEGGLNAHAASTGGLPQQRRPQSAKQRSGGKGKGRRRGDRSPGSPGSGRESSGGNRGRGERGERGEMDFELSALEQAEQVRIEQNKQLLRVLEEEQQAEAHREQRMRQIKSTEEKQRLEKIFGTWERQAMRVAMRL